MRECIWRKQIQHLSSTTTQIGRILCRDDESSLLKAVAAEEVYGFMLCDVTTPDYLIKEYEASGFLFPTVISRMEMTEDHLSPYMRERYIQEQRKPEPTVVQTYSGKNLFVMTPIVKLWMSIGMQVSNVQQFIQYQPGCALEPFVKKVYIFADGNPGGIKYVLKLINIGTDHVRLPLVNINQKTAEKLYELVAAIDDTIA